MRIDNNFHMLSAGFVLFCVRWHNYHKERKQAPMFVLFINHHTNHSFSKSPGTEKFSLYL